MRIKNPIIYCLRIWSLSIIIVFSSTINLNAQLQENLEFLDHSDIETELLDYKIIGDKIIYVEKNSRSEDTRVKIMNSNSQIEIVKDFSIPFESEVKIISKSDSIFSIFIYNLQANSRDYNSGGIYQINYNHGNISIDTIKIYLEARGTHESIVIDSSGLLIASSYGRIQFIKNKKVIKEIEDLKISGHLHQNAKSDIFMI